jgi:predicted Zn-dependent protease
MTLSAAHHPCPEFEAGIAHLAAGRWHEAVASLRSAHRREPGRLAIVRALATALLQVDDDRAARRALADFTLDNPMCAEGWRLAAQLEWKLNQYDDAMIVLARGLERLPHSQALHRQTALFWGARGKLEGSAPLTSQVSAQINQSSAEPDFLDRVAQDPKLLATLLDLPDDANDLAMLRTVETRLAALLACQPDHADRHFALARLQLKISALQAALRSVQQALRINPRYLEAHRLHATILGKLGEHALAIEVLKSLLRNGCHWPDIHCQIAELEKASGHADEARAHLYSAIHLNPRFEQAKQLLERWAA